MPLNDALLPEYDREMGATRRVLDRVADAHLAWRPHEKSMTLARLATHLAELPAWCPAILDHAIFELGPEGFSQYEASSSAGVLELFDRNVATARTALAGRSDGEYMSRWTFRKDGKDLFTMPKAAVIRTMVLNHMVHHRGQLTVYLRLLGIPLPALYGPTADEAA